MAMPEGLGGNELWRMAEVESPPLENQCQGFAGFEKRCPTGC